MFKHDGKSENKPWRSAAPLPCIKSLPNLNLIGQHTAPAKELKNPALLEPINFSSFVVSQRANGFKRMKYPNEQLPECAQLLSQEDDNEDDADMVGIDLDDEILTKAVGFTHKEHKVIHSGWTTASTGFFNYSPNGMSGKTSCETVPASRPSSPVKMTSTQGFSQGCVTVTEINRLRGRDDRRSYAGPIANMPRGNLRPVTPRPLLSPEQRETSLSPVPRLNNKVYLAPLS